MRSLEIQKNVEEKRLILGQRIEKFLLKKLSDLGKFLQKNFSTKSGIFYSCTIIIAISILGRSARDIGPESASYLGMVTKFFNGGKYGEDFWITTSPLVFYLTFIPSFLAKFFAINPIIFLEIFVNLIGLTSLLLSAKILTRSHLFKNKQSTFAFIILSFFCGFFLRVFVLQFNEFATQSSYFLALALPYISYHFISESHLKRLDQIIIGIIAGLLFCFNARYGILVLTFETLKFFERKKVLCLRNYVTLLALLLYSIFLIKIFPDYLRVLAYHYSQHSTLKALFIRTGGILREDLFPIILLSVLHLSSIKKERILHPLFLVTFAGALITIFEFSSTLDQRSLIYSLSLPLVVILVFSSIRDGSINLQKNWLLFFLLIFLPQFDVTFFELSRDLCVFWWAFILALATKWGKSLPTANLKSEKGLQSICNQIFLNRASNFWWYFFGLVTLTFLLSRNILPEIFWLFCAVIFLLLIGFYQNLYEKFFHKKEFSKLSTAAISLVIAYYLNLHLSGIFNLNTSSAYELKSPNYVSDQMLKMIKTHSTPSDEITLISFDSTITYPAIHYHKKATPTGHAALSWNRLEQRVLDDRNKLIFVEKYSGKNDDLCKIGFLENYFRNSKFQKDFNKNYRFFNRIIEQKSVAKSVKFFDEGIEKELPQSLEIIGRDVEVYIRK